MSRGERDFENYFTLRLGIKFAAHLLCVATLPCKIFDTFLTYSGQLPCFLCYHVGN